MNRNQTQRQLYNLMGSFWAIGLLIEFLLIFVDHKSLLIYGGPAHNILAVRPFFYTLQSPALVCIHVICLLQLNRLNSTLSQQVAQSHWIGKLWHWFAVYLSFIGFPLLALSVNLLIFLPLHDEILTYLHRFCLLVDLVFILLLLPRYHNSRGYWRIHSPWRQLPLYCVITIWGLTLVLLITYPGEWLRQKTPWLIRYYLEKVDDSQLGITTLNVATIDFSDLFQLNLRQRDFCNAKMMGTHLPGADFSGAKLTGVNLRESQLIGAIFVRTDLTDASLEQANLIHSDFRSATLNSASFLGADLTAANFRNADLTNAFLIGTSVKKVQLEGADLTDAYLPDL